MRVTGIVISSLLGLLCVLMIVTSVVFGSTQTVGLLGFNLFICSSGDYDSVPAGSVVITTAIAPYDLEEGNLVLYTTDPMDSNAPLSMGYYVDFKMTDNVYYLSLVNGTDTFVISENSLIGKAGWCSLFLGKFITFTQTPWGVVVMAVLPCAILLLCDFLRSKPQERELPEVAPQVKKVSVNVPDKDGAAHFVVKPDGGADYRSNPAEKGSRTADSVLFTYGQKKDSPEKTAPSMSEADVLSLLNSPLPKSETAGTPAAVNASAQKKADSKHTNNVSENTAKDKPSIPAPIAAKRYIDNTLNAGADKQSVSSQKNTDSRPDAFFTQSKAPQIGKGLAGKQTEKSTKSTRSIIDLEDALATAQPRTSPLSGGHSSGRKSADILAAKSRRDFIADDDDTRDKSRYAVDDIISGINKRSSK